jgi:hypothetical protein
MKRFIYLIFLALFFIGCSNVNNNDKANAALVENYIKAVENLDFDAMNEYLDDNYLGVGPSHSDSSNKITAVENWKYNVENVYRSIQYKNSRTIAMTYTEGINKGEWVLNWAELEINYLEYDNPVTIFANSVYLVENGKIKKSLTFYNEADVLEQLGFVFINPADL